MAEPKVSLLLTLVDKMTAPVEGAKKSLSSFGESVSGLGTKLAALGAGVALGAFFKSAVEEAINAEAATIRLSHAVGNAGESFDQWKPQIDATVNRLAKLTTFTDDDLAAALGDLITRTGDVSGSMKNMGLVTDLAANKNISLQESAALVAKGLAGGGRLFKEYGITAGTAAEKTEQLAKILEGSAAAAADSFGGRLSNLGKAWGEFKEDVGRAITANDAVGDSLTSLTAMIDQTAPYIANFVAAVVGGVVHFAGDLQIIATDAAESILQLPYQFKLAWALFIRAVANTIGENRVLLTIFGDSLTGIADKMGATGDRMMRESLKSIREIKAGHDEVIAGITATEAKGQKDRTNLTKAGSTARLEDEKQAGKEKVAVMTAAEREWEAVQAKFNGTFEEWTKRRRDIEAEAARATKAAWGLSYDYIIEQINRTISVQRTGAAVTKAAWDTIIDGLDGVYGAAERVPPEVGKIGDEAFNAARGAISLGKEMGVIDERAASVLNNVVNLADTLKDGLKGISAGNLIGAIGAAAGILGMMFSDGPEAKARKALIQKNNERLAELKDRMGELLNISSPGGKIASFQGIDAAGLVGASETFFNRTGPGGAYKVSSEKLDAGKVGGFLMSKGLSLTDFRQMAKDLGIDIGDDGKTFSKAGVIAFFNALNSGQFTGFDNSLTGNVKRSDWLVGITGGSAGDSLAGIGAALSAGNGSTALGGLFDGLNLGDGIDATEAGIIRQRTVGLAGRFAGGGVTAAEMGGASNSEFMAFISTIIGYLDTIAGATGTTASAVTSGGIGTVADTDLGTSIDLSTAAVGG